MSSEAARIILAFIPILALAYMYGVWLYQDARDAREATRRREQLEAERKSYKERH